MAVLLGIMRSNALMRDEACTCWKGAERNPQSHMRAWILFVCSVYALCFFLLCSNEFDYNAGCAYDAGGNDRNDDRRIAAVLRERSVRRFYQRFCQSDPCE